MYSNNQLLSHAVSECHSLGRRATRLDEL